MSKRETVTKWAAYLGTAAALWAVLAPSFWPVRHVQALTNLLLGEFAAVAIGHTAYRLASGKRAAPLTALFAAVLGAGIALSPLVFGLVTGFTTSNMVTGGVVAVAGVLAAVTGAVGTSERERGRRRRAEEDTAPT